MFQPKGEDAKRFIWAKYMTFFTTSFIAYSGKTDFYDKKQLIHQHFSISRKYFSDAIKISHKRVRTTAQQEAKGLATPNSSLHPTTTLGFS